MRIGYSFGVIGLCALAASCTTVSMQSILIDDINPETVGVSYALPKGMVEILIEGDGTKITVNKPTVSYLPDPENQFAIQIDENPWYSEKPTITTTTTGLLASVNADSTDAGPAIVESVVSLVTDIGLLGGTRAAPDDKKSGDAKKPKFQTRLVFDPLDPWQVHNATSALNAAVGKNWVRFQLLDINSNPLHNIGKNHNVLKSHAKSLREEAKKTSKNCKSSICFRLLTPIILRVTVESKTKQDFAMVVPNPLLVGELDVKRAPCVKTTTALAFNDGVLTSYAKDLPSTVLGCLAIPSTIVKGILGFPQELTERRSALLESEAGLLNQQTALIEAQQKLIAAQTAAAEATTNK
ncbi:MAG: hypothetical protein AAGA53_10085 [Pseudomonadota bacterium]